jgi:2-keto-3-deoxy-L-rhamnonate aldolase RhmA
MEAISFKTELAAGTAVPGVFVMEFASNGIAQIIKHAGARFVVFDMEHTGWTTETIARLVTAARAAGVAPVVRVPFRQPWSFGQALDAGAVGVIAPMVESADEARAIVAACNYPPDGRRGVAFGYTHDNYRLGDPVETMRLENQNSAVIVQIETVDGLRNVEDIAAVPGVDVLWVGHNDLSVSMGIPGQFDHPDYVAAVQRTIAASRRHGKSAGRAVGSTRQALTAHEQGFQCIAYNDIRIFSEALRAGILGLEEHAAETGET